jgi:hypothetical protein
VAPVLRANFDLAKRTVFGKITSESSLKMFQRVLALQDAMLGRARDAIRCWSVVGCRHGVVKDIRVMIAKMAWEDAWRW